jgi:hypothetical protein
MRAALMLCLLIFTMFQLGSPEQLKSSFEEKLRPYFQNAKVVLQPEQHGLMGLTCMQGAGPQLVRMAGDAFAQELSQQGLGGIATRLFLSAKGYRYVALGFDTWVIVFDLQTKGMSYKQTDAVASYGPFYRRECGL